MDTRIKIISNDEARAIQGAKIVSGYFDPVTSEHAERLRGLKESSRPLLILIGTPPDPILPAEARAQLVAALKCVDYVTIANGPHPSGLTPHVQLEAEDTERLEKLIRHVHARQQAAQQQ